MAPLTPFDRDAWSQAVSDTLHGDECADWVAEARLRELDQTQIRHGRSIAVRIVMAGLLALSCAAAIAVVIATVEIAADWVRAS